MQTCEVCGEYAEFRRKSQPKVAFCSVDHHEEWKNVGISFFNKKKVKMASRQLEEVFINNVHNMHKVMVGYVTTSGTRQRDYKEAAISRLKKDPEIISATLTNVLNGMKKDTSNVRDLKMKMARRDEKFVKIFEAILQDKKKSTKDRKQKERERQKREKAADRASDDILDDIFGTSAQIGKKILSVVTSYDTDEMTRMTKDWMVNVFSDSVTKIFSNKTSRETRTRIANVIEQMFIHTMSEYISLMNGQADAAFGHEDDTVRLSKELSALIIKGITD